MSSNDDRIQQVGIYQCAPQDEDKSEITTFDELSADELDNYQHAKDIVNSFVGGLEEKDYFIPARKNARTHDFVEQDPQELLNQLALISSETEDEKVSADQNSENSTNSEDDNKNNLNFTDLTSEICSRYVNAKNSWDCILLIVSYVRENPNFGSDDRVMIVQMPFIESDTYSPNSSDEDADSLFTELEDVFNTTLRKSILYPYQDIVESEEDGDDGIDDSPLGEAFLYQRNGQATYWYEFLGLDESPHKDELLLKQREQIVRAEEAEDQEDPEDPFAEIESLEDLTSDELPEEVEDFEDSGIVVELGPEIEISGLSIKNIRNRDPIRIGTREGETVVEIRGHEPSFRPVGQRKFHPTEKTSSDEDDGDNDSTDEIEAKDLEVFPELSEYPDLDDE